MTQNQSCIKFSMNSEINQKLEELSQYREALQLHLDDSTVAAEQHTIANFSNVVEELLVAEEELRAQTEVLQSSQMAIAAQQQRYQDLFEFAPDAYLVTTVDGMIQEANRAATQQIGLAARFLIDKPLSVFVVPEQRMMFREKLTKLVDTTDCQEWEFSLESRLDYIFDAAMTVSVVRNEVDQPIAVRWSIRDVSERKQAELQIRALNADLQQRTLIEQTLRQITTRLHATLDEREVLSTVVQEIIAALELLGCEVSMYNLPQQTATLQQQHIPTPIQSLALGEVVLMDDFPEGYAQLIRGHEFQFCELPFGQFQRQVSIFACPIADPQGVLGDIWCFSQVDQCLDSHQVHFVQQVAGHCAIALRQARLHAAIQNHANELDHLNQLKSDFISTLSHELRTPLTTMKMAMHLLKVATTEEQRERCLSILETECEREISLIGDLLDLQHLETASYPNFLLESIKLDEFLFIIIAPWQQRIQERQQRLLLDVPESLPPIVSDRASLRRLLLELIQNAHKHTSEGGEIVLQIFHAAEAASVTIVVKNQAHIPATDLPHIFEKFYRVRRPDSWNISGTGLGLALAQQLVQQLQGHIQVTSEDGWTTFTLTLPLRLSQPLLP
jgi:PAS domain S-box-containing protein